MDIVRRLLGTLIGITILMLVGTNIAQAESYKVQPGDTLSEIATKHDTTWPAIFKLNRDEISDPDLIFPGQKLEIDPGSKPKAKPAENSGSDQPASGKVRPGTGHVTSDFGYRTHPITGVYKLHTGTDFSYGDGVARAALGGTVKVSHPGWAGNLVSINHGGGVVTQYAHLASVSVSNGQRVSAGQKIGTIGQRGMATGPHLHFEVLIDGGYVNPLGWLE